MWEQGWNGLGLSLRSAVALGLASAYLGLSGQVFDPTAAVEPSGPDKAALGLVNLDLLDSRDGYAIPLDSRFLPGETIHVYGQVRGYFVDDEERVRLRYEANALDPGGRSFYMSEGGVIDVEVAPQDENWMPVVRYSPRIPEHAGGGAYTIRIEVRDELADASIQVSLPITVDGDRVEGADQLLIRDFRFSKAEGGAELEEPVFRPGETIWATFFITGYETRTDNTFDVASEAWVIDAEGERMFSFDSRSETGSPYYPRLWLPAKFRLDLEETIPPGSYAVVLRLRDRVGGTDATRQHAFAVR